MTRFQFAALVFLACFTSGARAHDLSEADKATFKANFKPVCMKTNAVVAEVLEPGAYEAMCDCASDRVLDRIRALPQNDALPLLNPDSEEGRKKWADMGHEASLVCGAKPFSQAMTKVIMQSCVGGKLTGPDIRNPMPALRCECIGQEFASRYTLAGIIAMTDQNAINRFAQQTLLIAQSACKPK